MNLIRRAILAIALIAGISPAIAQVPPPVPALPDTERRTSYSITATTCACNVNFALYGDSTDYQNWVEVYLNGVLVTFNDPTFGWTITSPTGPLSTIPRPVTDAVLIFNAVQTGTVQIVGARRPRRTAQFSENRGVAARDLNQTVTDITATLREMWDKTNDITGRGLFSQPGNTVGPLPLPASCGGKFLGFDVTGLIPTCTSGGAGTGNVVGPGSSTDGDFALYNGTTGALIKDAPATVIQSALQNRVWASPNGSTGAPAFRALVGADLPNPSISTLGGVESLTCATHQWLNTISVAGVPACAQPSFADISGIATAAQGGTGSANSGFNFVNCGGVDDSTALQAAITAMPSTGGYLQLPVNGNSCIYATTLDFRGKNFIQVIGGGTISTTGQATNLIYSGSAARAIDMRDTNSNSIAGVSLGWNNASFAGIMVDYGSQTPGSSVSFYGRLTRNTFNHFGSGALNAVTCANFSEAIEFVVEISNFSDCKFGIHGQNVLGQSTVGLISHNQFFNIGTMPIQECGESWTLVSNTFENLTSGKAGALQNSSTLPCRAMVLEGNWFGDVTVSGNTWVTLTATGFTAIGDKMSANNSGSNQGYSIVGGSGYSWKGGTYDGMSIGFSCDVTTKPTGMHWEDLTLTNVTTAISGPANCLNASEASNTPAVFGNTWTPTFTPGGGATPSTVNNAKFRRNGLTTEYWFKATFGTVTGTGSLTIGGLPFAASQNCVFFGNDQTSSQSSTGQISTGGTSFLLFLASNPATYPVATGGILSMHGSCETL